jgi:hypothetical protein
VASDNLVNAVAYITGQHFPERGSDQLDVHRCTPSNTARGTLSLEPKSVWLAKNNIIYLTSQQRRNEGINICTYRDNEPLPENFM